MKENYKTTRISLLVFILIGIGGIFHSAGAGEPLFTGRRALVIQPVLTFGDGGSAIYGKLEEKGFEVEWGNPSDLEDSAALAGFDLVATDIQRSFTSLQEKRLKDFVSEGGALYGSWGGPLGSHELLRVCGVETGGGSVRLREMTLTDSPLTAGLGRTRLLFPIFYGDKTLLASQQKNGWGIISFKPINGAISVATDDKGNCFGVLNCYGKGRAAALGFIIEDYKRYFYDPCMADRVFDNLMTWLLPNPPKLKGSNKIQVNLPVRAEVLSVSVDGHEIAAPLIKTVGSLKKICLDMSQLELGKETRIVVRYRPLSKARNVDAAVFVPSVSSLSIVGNPVKAVDFVEKFKATVVILGHCGRDVSRGAKQGDYLAEFIDECHMRGIKVMGDLYLHDKPLINYPETFQVEKDGKTNTLKSCFYSPKMEENHLLTIANLLEDYQLDSFIIDDNYENRLCYCQHCKNGFRKYCEGKRISYKDPSDPAVGGDFYDYNRKETQLFCNKARALCAGYNVPFGGWVQGNMLDLYLADNVDFLGGMIYPAPAYGTRGIMSKLGNRPFITLLWGLNRTPQAMQEEVTEAVRAGSYMVGFYIVIRGVEKSMPNLEFSNWGYKTDEGGQRIEPGGFDAMAGALGRVESDWLAYYRDDMVTGDARFVVLAAQAGAEKLEVKIENNGEPVKQRMKTPPKIDFPL